MQFASGKQLISRDHENRGADKEVEREERKWKIKKELKG